MTPDSVLRSYWHVPQLAAALAARGHATTIIQAFYEATRMRHGDVDVVMTGDASSDRPDPHQVPEVVANLNALRPQIVHVFGLARTPQLAAIVASAKRIGARLSASFHGGTPHWNPLARLRHRRALADLAAIYFSAPHYAKLWRRSGVLRPETRIVIAPEVSSPLVAVAREIARRDLGLEDSTVLAWSGRLHPNKDPLTVLRAFERIVAHEPRAQLLMAFQTRELFHEVSGFLAERPVVGKRVLLLGEVPHERMAVVFSAADFFVQASLREFGGNSLVEAMSCGAIPVVTDIPSFRQLTDQGRQARLFLPGDAAAMARMITTLASDDRRELAARVRAYFDAHLSYPALARIYDATFRSILKQS